MTVPNGTLVGRDAKCGRTLWDSTLPETPVTVVPRRPIGTKTPFLFAVSKKSPPLAEKAPMVNANEGHRKPQKHDTIQLLDKVALSTVLCIQLKATAPCRRMTPYNFWTRWPFTNLSCTFLSYRIYRVLSQECGSVSHTWHRRSLKRSKNTDARSSPMAFTI